MAEVSYEIALNWMPLDITDDKSRLVQVMACCPQATSLYLSQFWPRCRQIASLDPNELKTVMLCAKLCYNGPQNKEMRLLNSEEASVLYDKLSASGLR